MGYGTPSNGVFIKCFYVQGILEWLDSFVMKALLLKLLASPEPIRAKGVEKADE